MTLEGIRADGTKGVEALPWDVLGKGAKIVDVAGGVFICIPPPLLVR